MSEIVRLENPLVMHTREHDTGLEFIDDLLTEEDFYAGMQQEIGAYERKEWIIADGLAYGVKKWGQKIFHELHESTGHSISHLKDLHRTGLRISRERRIPTLFYSTHRLAATLPTKELQDEVLEKANDEHLTHEMVVDEVAKRQPTATKRHERSCQDIALPESPIEAEFSEIEAAQFITIRVAKAEEYVRFLLKLIPFMSDTEKDMADALVEDLGGPKPKPMPIVGVAHIAEYGNLNNAKFREAWAQWMECRKEKGLKLTDKGAAKQMAFLSLQSDPVACIEQSIRQNYQGIFEVRKGREKPTNLKGMAELAIAQMDGLA